jgi:hypothetical protein
MHLSFVPRILRPIGLMSSVVMVHHRDDDFPFLMPLLHVPVDLHFQRVVLAEHALLAIFSLSGPNFFAPPVNVFLRFNENEVHRRPPEHLLLLIAKHGSAALIDVNRQVVGIQRPDSFIGMMIRPNPNSGISNFDVLGHSHDNS